MHPEGLWIISRFRATYRAGRASLRVVEFDPATRDVARSADQAGPEPFEVLYRREQAPMLRLAVLLVGSRAQAEEVVQDAFASTNERWAEVSNPGGYLRSSVVNGCRMVLRRRALETRSELPVVSDVDPPNELVELHDAMRRLSERQRVVIVLRYFLGRVKTFV